MTGGKGWIVIALVIFSAWNPARVVIGTLVFGGITSLQFSIQAAGLKLMIPAQFLGLSPYLITLLVLVAMTIIAEKRQGAFASPSTTNRFYATMGA